LGRDDELAIWGIGIHPGLESAVTAFDAEVFSAALEQAIIVGEVGLDGRSTVPMKAQRRVFDAILEAVSATPRPISIHSVGASAEVLSALRARPTAAPILHWWRGDSHQTREAVELGCFFSLNGAEAARPKVMDLIPRERVLTETDFPFTRRSDRAAVSPGATTTIEKALAGAWSIEPSDVRRQIWRNLGQLMAAASQTDRLPSRAKQLVDAVA
jgi:TatD DNase family protein